MASGSHILVIDDNVGLCKSLANILDDEGYQVAVAHTGADGLAALKEGPTDLVLLDIRLPDGQGIDLLSEICEIHPDAAVIVITAYASLETAVQALHIGAHAYVLKPLDMKEVMVTISRALERRRLVVQERRLTEQLQVLNQAALTMTAELEPERVLQTIIDLAQGLVNASYGALLMLGEDGCVVKIHSTEMSAEIQQMIGQHPLELGTWGFVLREAKSWRLGDSQQDTQFDSLDRHPVVSNFLGVPIVSRGTVLGGLFLANKISDSTQLFTKEDQQVIEAMALQAAVAVENARLYESERLRTYELGERIKDLNCLYSLSALMEDPALELEVILQKSVALIPMAWRYPEMACARIVFGEQEYRTENFDPAMVQRLPAEWRQSQDILVHGGQVGRVEVCYLQPVTEMENDSPFLKEEQSLLTVIAEQFGGLVERKITAEQLRHAALHDTLTGLPNRMLFTERLERAIQRSRESPDHLFAVLYLDLDRLKVVNDSLGHPVGDQLLMAIAHRLELCVREEDTIARFGGDEFAVLLDGIKDIGQAEEVARRIQKRISLSIDLENREAFSTASIGIASNAIVPYNWTAAVLRDADTAMYRAKALGKACHILFDTDMYAQAVERYQMEADLRRGIERQEFLVHYQPFFSLADDRIAGVEALLRWQHPEKGLVNPDEFVPLAEEIGLIDVLGEWVLRTACAQVQTWHDAGYDSLRLAINVSFRQFRDPHLAMLVKRVLRDTGMKTQKLELEVTESVAVGEQGVATLVELNQLGVRVSLDDFGIGSSLDCLKRLPLDTLKIDQSFVGGISDDELSAGNESIVISIIDMAHRLGLRVVAEGVETEEQLAFLRENQCDEVQGYLVSASVSADGLGRLLQEMGHRSG